MALGLSLPGSGLLACGIRTGRARSARVFQHVAGLADQVRDIEGGQADRCTRPRAGRRPQAGSGPCGFSARAGGSAARAGRGWSRTSAANGRFPARRQGRCGKRPIAFDYITWRCLTGAPRLRQDKPDELAAHLKPDADRRGAGARRASARRSRRARCRSATPKGACWRRMSSPRCRPPRLSR